MSEEAAKNEAPTNENVTNEATNPETVVPEAITNEAAPIVEPNSDATSSEAVISEPMSEEVASEEAMNEAAPTEAPTDATASTEEANTETIESETVASEEVESENDATETISDATISEEVIANPDAANPATAKETLSAIWNALSFPFKEQLSLNEKEELVLVANAFRKEKVIAPFQPYILDKEVNKLHDNFQKLQEHATTLQAEFEAATDPLKMRPAIRSFEQKMAVTDAIGDFSHFTNQFNQYKAKIDAIYAANTEARQQLAEEAKSLVDKKEWQATTEQFKDIIERWKAAPEVKRTVNEQYWQIINEAKDAFFDKKRKHYEEQETEQMVNLDRKLELCEKAAALENSENWKATTEKLQKMMDEWKTIGQLPSAEKNDEMWARFSGSRKAFFDRKQVHSDTIKVEQENNYIEKVKLVEEAENICNSTEWKATADRMAALQASWDALGRAPKEFNDALWARWKTARNTFYDAKRSQAQQYVANLNENFDKKKVLTERAEHLSKSENWKLATEELTQLMTEWKTIGPVPKERGDDLWNRFNEARRQFFKRKDDDRDSRKERYEKIAREKWSQAEQFLYSLQQELKEEEEQLAEFQESVNTLGDENKKDKELKEHLHTLIEKLNTSIPKRKEKIEEVKGQMEKNNAAK